MCNDNPFVSRDKNKWKLFHKAASYYDLIAYQDVSRIYLAKKKVLQTVFLIYLVLIKKLIKKI